MRIRDFIVMGVFLGAATLMPDNAFAEKNGAASQSEPQNSPVHTQVLEKVENPIASEKAVPVTSENANKSQGEAVQKSVAKPRTQQYPTKPVSKSPNKTNRSNEKAVPPFEKNSKAGESSEPAVKVKAPEQTGPVKPSGFTNKLPEVSKSLSSKQPNSKAETKKQPSGSSAKSKTFTEDTESTVPIKMSSSLTMPQNPSRGEENKTPSHNRGNPVDIEIMSNPPQRTQSSGGHSNEQFSAEAGTISFIANRFDWNEYFGLNLGQIYTSRQVKYCHQWSNAPPLPPPKTAPFLNV